MLMVDEKTTKKKERKKKLQTGSEVKKDMREGKMSGSEYIKNKK